jgi:nucleoside-diphosphate-sugar epimerase
MLGEGSSPQTINGSARMFWYNVISAAPKTKERLGGPLIWVDVRDLAEEYVLALEKEKAGGQRILSALDMASGKIWVSDPFNADRHSVLI